MLKKRTELRIGDRLREVRETRGMTLRELARIAGVSESLVSQIEHNRVSPSIETLLAIADALELDLEYLFRDFRRTRDVSIVREQDRRRIITGTVRYEQLSVIRERGDEHAIEAFLLTIAPGGEKGSTEYGHPGREMGFILEGRGELKYGTGSHPLNRGDSVTFASDSPHVLRNTGYEDLVAVWVTTPPKMLFGPGATGTPMRSKPERPRTEGTNKEE